MTNAENRIKFNDRIILLIGIPVIAITGVLVLGRGIIREHELSILVTIFGSTLSTLVIWLGVRKIVIYLWDKYPWEKDPVRHLLIEIAAIITYTMMAGVFLSLFWQYFNPDYIRTGDLGMNIFFSLVITFFITSLHEGWFFFQQWKKTLVLSEKLSKENIQSQFETLKSQISPHFLFNNLNTLASLIEEEVFLITDAGPGYAIDYTLEKLESVLDPDKFYRINRKFIVSFHCIKTMYSWSRSRIKLVIV
jgi:hypothetical protein